MNSLKNVKPVIGNHQDELRIRTARGSTKARLYFSAQSGKISYSEVDDFIIAVGYPLIRGSIVPTRPYIKTIYPTRLPK